MRFGILGTANIGRAAVIPAIRKTNHEVVAVGSRSSERAQGYAEEFDIPHACGSYEAVFDADIDAIYNPLPNAFHAEWCRRAIDAGLHVLCEKPITTDAEEASALFDHCADANVTVMEGFMYRFHPRTKRAREIVRDELSTLRSMSTSFTVSLPNFDDDIRFSPDLGGGSLLDVGCYAADATREFLGDPDRVSAHVLDTRNCGVDTAVAARFEYDGAHAQIRCGFDTRMLQHYRVEAENGWLEAEEAFVPGPEQTVSLRYRIDDREGAETFDPADHYRLQIEAFADAVEGGGDPPITGDESIATMRILDAIRNSDDMGVPVEP